MADAKRVVETVFTVVDKATKPLRAVTSAMMGIAGTTKKAVGAVSSVAFAWQTWAIGIGVVYALRKAMLDLNGQAENAQIAIAGMIQAGGVVKEWDAAMNVTEGVMAQIRKDAAELPGEFDDFLQVFQSALPKALESGLNPQQVAKFTNAFGAVSIALGTDAAQAGRDLQLMLSGRAGAHVAMWNKLSSHIGKTAEEFNKLDIVARRKAIEAATGKFGDMISAYGNTWDAIYSTTTTHAKNLMRIASQPMFNQMKETYKGINKYLDENQAKIERIARLLGKSVVHGVNAVEEGFKRVYKTISAIVNSPAFKILTNTLGKMASKAMSAIGSAVSGAAARVAKRSGGAENLAGMAAGSMMGGPMMIMLGSAVGQFMTHIVAVASVVDSIANIFGSLITIVEPTIEALGMMGQLLGDTAAIILPPFMAAVAVVVDALTVAWNTVLASVISFMTTLAPVVNLLVAKVGTVITSIGRVLAPAIEILGKTFGWLVDNILTPYLIPLFGDLVSAISPVIDALSWFLDSLADILNWIASWFDDEVVVEKSQKAAASAKATVKAMPTSSLGNFLDKLAAEDASEQAAMLAKKKNGGTPGIRPKAGTSTNFDFRGSRFNVMQKFEEGFDPDRIAVSFVNDIAKLGERKSQSGFAPATGVR